MYIVQLKVHDTGGKSCLTLFRWTGSRIRLAQKPSVELKMAMKKSQLNDVQIHTCKGEESITSKEGGRNLGGKVDKKRREGLQGGREPDLTLGEGKGLKP